MLVVVEAKPALTVAEEVKLALTAGEEAALTWATTWAVCFLLNHLPEIASSWTSSPFGTPLMAQQVPPALSYSGLFSSYWPVLFS